MVGASDQALVRPEGLLDLALQRMARQGQGQGEGQGELVGSAELVARAC